jgi:hypothetical protein
MSKMKRTAKAPDAPKAAPAKRIDEFTDLANQRSAGLLGELKSMIMQNKKWWLIPILVTLLVLSLIVFLGGTGAAPFIYTL